MSSIEVQGESETHPRKPVRTDKEAASSSQPQYKGMTLKEYFGIGHRIESNNQIDQIEGESGCSSEQSVKTPAFSLEKVHGKQTSKSKKVKTEASDMTEHQQLVKNNLTKYNKSNPFYLMSKNGHNVENRGVWNVNHHFDKQTKKNNLAVHQQRAKISSIPARNPHNLINRSTLTSFYQLELKKKKMLKKIKLDRNKINQPRFSDAFFITKYGGQFNIDPKRFK